MRTHPQAPPLPHVALALAVLALPRPAAARRPAPLPAPLAAVSRALAAATRYRLLLATPARTGRPPLATAVIVVGPRAARVYAVVLAATAGGAIVVSAEYVAGATVCQRAGAAGPFACAHNPATAAAVRQGLDPLPLLARPGLTLAVVPVPARAIGGRRCAGYRVVGRTATGATVVSTLYAEPRTHRPCALDQATGLRLEWSHLDDPRLTIPPLARGLAV